LPYDDWLKICPRLPGIARGSLLQGPLAMKVESRIVQSKFGNRLTFEFGPERLSYACRDANGERRFPVSYESIDVTTSSSATIGNPEFIQRMLLVPLVLWVLSMVLARSNPAISSVLFNAAAELGIFLLVCKFFGVFSVEFAELPLTAPPSGAGDLALRIVRNKDYDTIMGELTRRWKARMKEIHGTVDFNNDADSELDKFRWLKLHEVIDDAEFARIAEQLRTYAAVRARPLPSEGTIN